ncbi:hypothetical protein PR202_gb17363 [Eleusine coracana subsp. coracana]|uniref:Uncharacterized protein n=1 Tax=Eleusine coracana subsp. coracana TaxID=191504 RepID=A0AAV5F2Q9_ELECO|nr:hypothetical protein PR202_gb17363 [Eleusine coracana subsp. coracana]
MRWAVLRLQRRKGLSCLFCRLPLCSYRSRRSLSCRRGLPLRLRRACCLRLCRRKARSSCRRSLALLRLPAYLAGLPCCRRLDRRLVDRAAVARIESGVELCSRIGRSRVGDELLGRAELRRRLEILKPPPWIGRAEAEEISRKWHFEGDEGAKEKSMMVRELSRALGSRSPPN